MNLNQILKEELVHQPGSLPKPSTITVSTKTQNELINMENQKTPKQTFMQWLSNIFKTNKVSKRITTNVFAAIRQFIIDKPLKYLESIVNQVNPMELVVESEEENDVEEI